MESISLYLSAAFAVAIPALATGWAQSRIGPAAAATLAEKPEMSTTVILLIAIPETVAILGFVVSVLILLQAGGVTFAWARVTSTPSSAGERRKPPMR